MAIFSVYMDSDHLWRWRLVAQNNACVAVSGEGYHNFQDCLHAIRFVKAESPSASAYDLTRDPPPEIPGV